MLLGILLRNHLLFVDRPLSLPQDPLVALLEPRNQNFKAVEIHLITTCLQHLTEDGGERHAQHLHACGVQVPIEELVYHGNTFVFTQLPRLVSIVHDEILEQRPMSQLSEQLACARHGLKAEEEEANRDAQENSQRVPPQQIERPQSPAEREACGGRPQSPAERTAGVEEARFNALDFLRREREEEEARLKAWEEEDARVKAEVELQKKADAGKSPLERAQEKAKLEDQELARRKAESEMEAQQKADKESTQKALEELCAAPDATKSAEAEAQQKLDQHLGPPPFEIRIPGARQQPGL